ncbi:PAS domain-containing sensor histidine kinase [Halorubrum halophilum]|uniref:PAS domain-containing sensor histidine kinase n=1 Tax=Halorubrum halophilum TaxID=413816 RepID=UPI0009E258DD|nr:PAS domain-containing sensor histidine kinase [Halorubrum halophilum]
MSPPPGSSDGDFFADTVDRVARQGSRTLAENLAEMVSDGVYQLSSDLRFVAVNEAFAAMTGYSRNELLEEHLSVLFSDESTERLEDEIAQQRELLPPTPIELSGHAAQGEPIECLVRVSVLSSDTGQGSLGVVRSDDVTYPSPHESTPRADDVLPSPLEEEESELRHVLDRVSDGFFGLDDEWRFTYLNDRAAEVLGFSPENATGEVLWDLFPEAVGSPFRRNCLRAMREQESASFEAFFPPLNSWFEVSVSPSVTGLSVYFRDVTERRERQQAVRDRERELEAHKDYVNDVLNAIDDLFYVIDRAGRFRRWNESVRSVTGYSDEELEEMGPLGFIVEADRERVAGSIGETFKTGNGRVEASIRTKGGETVPIEFVASVIETPADERMIAGIGRDISERNQRQRRLEESNERLEQFAYAASHDLQEPLRMVSSYLQLIEERYGDALDDDGQEFLDFAVDGADRMCEMIDGLLAYSRIESEGDSFEPVELEAVIEDVQDALQMMCDEHRAEITTDSLPHVEGDRGQLRQLFQNLLDNAMANSGDAPPEIHVSAERVGERWLVSVRDEGIGIDPADADRIFEVFQSLDGPDENGSGIGLALCKRIVERHGGSIWVDSQVGDGATFSFTLPAVGDDGE